MDNTELFRIGKYRVEVGWADPESIYFYDPRSTIDNLGKFYWHIDARRFDICSSECTQEDAKKFVVKLPVYLYSHSGESIHWDNSVYPFNDRWDACHAGYIGASREDILKWYTPYGEPTLKRLTAELKQRALNALKSEVEIYNQYLNNQVFEFQIVDDTDDLIDVCTGYYSKEDALEEGIASAKTCYESDYQNDCPLLIWAGIKQEEFC